MKNFQEQYLELTKNAEDLIKSKAIGGIITLPCVTNVYFYGEHSFINKEALDVAAVEDLMPISLFSIADLLNT